MIFGKRRQTVPVPSGTQSVGIIGDTDPPSTGLPPQWGWVPPFPFPIAGYPEPSSSRDPLPPGYPVSDFLSSADAAVLCTRCVVVVTGSVLSAFSVTVLHPHLFPPEAMTDTMFHIVRSASDEGFSVYAALVPSPCPPHVRTGRALPFSEDEACAAASPLLWPSLSASPFKRPPAGGRLTCSGGMVDWPRGLVLGGSLPGEPFSLPKGGFCWRPLGWSP